MDLTTTYLGLQLKNPIVPSSSPLSYSLENMKRLEDAGAAAIVMFSLFEEQVQHEANEIDHYLRYGTHSFAEAVTYFPKIQEFSTGPDGYLDLIRKAKESLAIPIIGSLNGISVGGWVDFAKGIQSAGADALELNIYYIPTDSTLVGEYVEQRYLDVLKAVRGAVDIPLAVKLSPFFSSTANIAKQLVESGADGLVLFNRFYQPDIDLEALEVKPEVVLSQSTDALLAMRWIAIMYGNVPASLAATGGVHTAQDVLKMMMVGADVAMMCSALLKHGPQHIATVLRDLQNWMLEKEYVSIEQMKGSMSHKSVADPSAFERANYMKALNRFKLLV